MHRLLEAGNRVHFELGNCYVQHIKSGVRTNIVERGGVYEVGLCAAGTGSENPG